MRITKVDYVFRISLIPLIFSVCVAPATGEDSAAKQHAEGTSQRRQLVDQLKNLEAQLGFHRTGNFARANADVPAYYRCYFTGLLELPDSYDDLQLRNGTRNGCSIDTGKYDVFFYPIEAVASGKAPITRALEAASDDRVAMVIPHEDFHAQVRDLPDRLAEAAATLVGFVTAEAVRGAADSSNQAGDSELFLQKANIVNRYYDRLSALYGGVERGSVPKKAALNQKRVLFAELAKECGAIAPSPRSFNKCISVMNNAGVAFDHTYTLYYPLLHQVFVAEGRDLRATVAVIVNAPKRREEADVVRYLSEIVRAGRERQVQTRPGGY